MRVPNTTVAGLEHTVGVNLNSPRNCRGTKGVTMDPERVLASRGRSRLERDVFNPAVNAARGWNVVRIQCPARDVIGGVAKVDVSAARSQHVEVEVI